jgi:hypothetical protein
MSSLSGAALVAIGALVAAALLAGCGGSGVAPSNRGFHLATHRYHSAIHHYSVREVEQAFGAEGVQLRNVSPKNFKGLLAFLDGRPTHPVYVYVSLEGCKCALTPAIRNARLTRHGNLEVLWRARAKSAVRGALRELN